MYYNCQWKYWNSFEEICVAAILQWNWLCINLLVTGLDVGIDLTSRTCLKGLKNCMNLLQCLGHFSWIVPSLGCKLMKIMMAATLAHLLKHEGEQKYYRSCYWLSSWFPLKELKIKSYLQCSLLGAKRLHFFIQFCT